MPSAQNLQSLSALPMCDCDDLALYGGHANPNLEALQSTVTAGNETIDLKPPAAVSLHQL